MQSNVGFGESSKSHRQMIVLGRRSRILTEEGGENHPDGTYVCHHSEPKGSGPRPLENTSAEATTPYIKWHSIYVHPFLKFK